MRLLSNLLTKLSIREAHAHCDIPCGIYDPVSAKIAAQTVLKMVDPHRSGQGSKDGTTAWTTASVGKRL